MSNLVILFVFITAFTALQLLVYTLHNRKKLKLNGFLGLIFCLFLYSLFYSFELISPNLRVMKFCAAMQYIGILSIPPFWLIMSLEYTNQVKYLSRKLYIGLFILPVILELLNLTNDYHHLFYSNYTAHEMATLNIADITPGFGYILATVYVNICLLIGNIIYIWYFKKGSPVFRKRSFIIMISSFIPWIGYWIYMFNILPVKIDIVPVFLEIVCLIYAYSLVKTNIFETAAIARHVIFDNIAEAIIVLDTDNKLIDLNNRAQQLFKRNVRDVIGKDIFDEFHCFLDNKEYIDKDCETGFDMEIGVDGNTYYFKVRKSIVESGGNKAKVIVLNDNTEQIMMINKLQYYGTMDILTGVYNRYHFYDIANEKIENCRKRKQLISVIMFDLDLFKAINDTYGHTAGDTVLQEVTAVCKSCLAEKYPVGRYGGEEFIIIIDNLKDKQVYNIAEELRRKIMNQNIKYEDKLIHVTISLGIYIAKEEDDLDVMIRNVDAALYEAKKAGRNQICVKTGNIRRY